MNKNIKVDYIYKFFMAFDITAAIWVLYLGYKGMNLIEIGLLESIFHITGLIVEIPTGAFADLLGRRKVIILGRISFLLSCIIMLFAKSFLGFALGFIVQALSYNLNSGSEEALIYDTALELNEEYTKICGRINLIIEVSQGLAVFIGGILAESNFTLSYIAAIMIGLCALGISFSFKETEIFEKKEKISIVKHFKDSVNILKNNKILVKFLMYFPWIFAFSTTIYFYAQQAFNDLCFSKISIAVIFLINGIFSSIGSIVSAKIDVKFKGKAYILIAICMGVSIVLFGICNGAISMVMFWISGFFSAALYPISSNKLNECIPSEQRATILSIESMICSLAMIVIFPIVGFIGEYSSINVALIIIGVSSILLSLKDLKKNYN